MRRHVCTDRLVVMSQMSEGFLFHNVESTTPALDKPSCPKRCPPPCHAPRHGGARRDSGWGLIAYGCEWFRYMSRVRSRTTQLIRRQTDLGRRRIFRPGYGPVPS